VFIAGVGLLLIAAAALVLLRGRLPLAARAATRPTPGATTPPHPRRQAAANEPAEDPIRRWVLRDIPAPDAREWIARGFDADHAYLLRSMGITPAVAGQLRDAGLEPSALVSLVEEASFRHRTAVDDLIALVERSPQLAPQAVAWISSGIDTDRALACAGAGFTPEAAAPWRSAGWSIEDALPWFTARFEPSSAAAWREQGFTADEALAWKREHFGVRQAAEWRHLGDTPARARDVERRLGDANVTVTDALRWIECGFTIDEICAGWAQLAVGDHRSWRAEWKGLSLTPAEIAAWCARFEQDEAVRWVDAGVRDPKAAARLRARGVDPDRVTRVASRLAEVFDAVPVTRDDLLSAAGQLARAGGSADVRHRLQIAAAKDGYGQPKEVPAALIEDVLDELARLEDEGALGAPHAARALARRLEEGLIVSALITGRRERTRVGSRNN
jgi:hypothetical protein